MLIPHRCHFQVSVPSSEDVLRSGPVGDVQAAADPAFDPSLTPVHLQEHQYCLPDPDLDRRVDQKTKSITEPKFAAYNNITRCDQLTASQVKGHF